MVTSFLPDSVHKHNQFTGSLSMMGDNMTARQLAALILLAALWGASYLFIRIASPVLGPLVLMDIRVFLACGGLLLYAFLRQHTPDFRGRWRQLLLLGAINAAIPFSLIAFAQLTLTASLASILNSTTPLFTAAIASIWLRHRLKATQIFGIVLGIIGVMVLVGGAPMALSIDFLIPASASLGAAFFYGLGSNYASRAFSGIAAQDMAIGQLFGAGTVLLIPAILAPMPTVLSPDVILAVLSLAFLCTSLAYLLYFYLIASVGPTRTASVTFLIPVFGTIWGHIFLQEPVSSGMILGMMIILTSVGLVNGLPIPANLRSW